MKLLNELCFYNDKKAAWMEHDENKIEKVRDRYLQDINSQLFILGKDKFPEEFLNAVETGKLSTDLTGKYYDIAKTVKV